MSQLGQNAKYSSGADVFRIVRQSRTLLHAACTSRLWPKSDLTPHTREPATHGLGSRQAAEALSSGPISDLAGNGFVR
jgi:hypothetical protein